MPSRTPWSILAGVLAALIPSIFSVSGTAAFGLSFVIIAFYIAGTIIADLNQ